MKNEIWKPIPGYDGWYEASNIGRVRSWVELKRNKTGHYTGEKIKSKTPRILRVGTSHDGYKQVVLAGVGEKVHRVVAKAFIPNPDNKSEVNHLDGNKSNNHVSNLEWVTRSENQRHAFDKGLYGCRKGEHAHNRKLTKKDVLEIRELHSEGTYTGAELAKIYDVTQSTISSIVLRKSWKHLTGDQK